MTATRMALALTLPFAISVVVVGASLGSAGDAVALAMSAGILILCVLSLGSVVRTIRALRAGEAMSRHLVTPNWATSPNRPANQRPDVNQPHRDRP